MRLHPYRNEPPDRCPLRAGPGDFKPYAAPGTEAASGLAQTRWRCLLCNYVHEGPEPPDPCPVCGAEPECFKKVETEAAPVASTASAATTARLVIVGGGIAGLAAAEAARAASPSTEITLVSSEKGLPYYRLSLTRYLAGEITRDALPIHPEAWYAEQRIRLLRSAQVTQLDTTARTASLADGTTLPYDRLMLTAGASPNMPPLPGIELDGVFSLRTVTDADALLARLTPGTPASASAVAYWVSRPARWRGAARPSPPRTQRLARSASSTPRSGTPERHRAESASRSSSRRKPSPLKARKRSKLCNCLMATVCPHASQ